MSIIGKWKVAFIADFGEDGRVWTKPDDFRAAHNDDQEEMNKMLGTTLIFEEGGKFFYCLPIPPEATQEQIDEAVKAGAIRVKDGCISEEKAWKGENGKYYYDSGIKGEVFGEPVSSWEELVIEDDGTLNFMEMLRFEKI